MYSLHLLCLTGGLMVHSSGNNVDLEGFRGIYSLSYRHLNPSCQTFVLGFTALGRLLMHDRSSCLVVREDQGVRNDHILPSPSSKNNRLGDVVWGQRLTAPSK